MAQSVYVETSVISYYTARPSRDIVSAARQTITQEWWDERRQQFDLYVSALVIEEAKIGDPEAAIKRMNLISGLNILDITVNAEELANYLVELKLVPKSSMDDAFHIALATVNGIDFLLTKNLEVFKYEI